VIKQNPAQKVGAQFVYTEVKMKSFVKEGRDFIKQAEKIPDIVILLDKEKAKKFYQEVMGLNAELDDLKKNISILLEKIALEKDR
jgi:hypothetical protein